YNQILNNTASNNGNCGITLGKYGDADYNIVDGNKLSYNQAGINSASSYSNITGNWLSKNGNYGAIVTAGHVKLAQNTVLNNTDGGILLIGTYNTVDSNSFNNNPLGIVLQSSGSADYNWVINNVLNWNNNGINSGSSYSYIINNTITNCTENGLVNTANHVNITGNRIEYNNGTGILCIGTYNQIRDNILTNNCVGICLQKSTGGDYNSVTGNNANSNDNGINNGSPCTELNNNTVNNNVENGIVNTASNVNIEGNTVLNNGGTGILVVGSYINIFNNVLTGNNLGIYLQNFGNNDYNVLTNNTASYNINGINSGSNGTNFYNNTLNYNNQTGLTITGSNCYVVGNSMCYNKEAGLTITGTNNVVIMNRLEQNLYGASFSNYNAAIFCFNSVIGNTYQLYSPDTSGTLNAIDNWWGSNSAPSRVYGLFNVSPWIVLKLVPSTNKVNVGGVSNITADLTWNSAGEDTDLVYTGVFVPDGILVKFSCDSLGILSDLVLSLVNGTATSSFTGKTVGSSTILASVNDQNVTTSVTVMGVTSLNVNSASGHKGDVLNLVSTLKDGNNQPVNGKTIKFYVDGNLVGTALTDSSGVATLSYTLTQDPGSHPVVAQFLGDGFYTASNGTSNLLVSSTLVITNITVKPVSGYNGDIVNLTATLKDGGGNPVTGKTVVFYVNGSSVGSATTDSNGVATFVYILTQSSGSYTIMALFLQDGTYLASNSTNSLQVNLKPTSIIISPVTGYRGDKLNLTATLKDSNTNPLPGKTINFYINGTQVGTATTNTDGTANYLYTINQTSGNYSFLATFTQDGIYGTSNCTSYLLVNLTPTKITVNSVTGRKGYNVNLTANLTDTHSSLQLAGKQITFYINGTPLGTATTNADGLASYVYNITQNTGTYTITSIYSGDTTYSASNNTNILQVNLIPTSIITGPVTGYRGDKLNLTATLKDSNTNPLPGKTINFYINGTQVGTATTNTDGTANYLYTLILTNGTYPITASFAQDGTYAGSDGTNIIQINLIPTKITLNHVTSYRGNDVNLTASLTDDQGAVIAGKIVRFYIDGSAVGNAQTDVNGVASVVYCVSESSKNCSMMVEFIGDDDYTEAMNTEILEIIPEKTVLSVLPVSSYSGAKTGLKATLQDRAGSVLSGKLISFLVNSHLIGTATTNSEGIATLTYAISGCGSYNLSAMFSEDGEYNSSSDSESWLVKMIPTKLVVKSLNGYNGDKLKLSATLINTINNTAVSGRTVYFYVNGKYVGSGVTNSTGIASYIYLIKEVGGSYSLRTDYKQDNLYANSTFSTTLNVNKIPTKILTNSASGKKNSRVKLTATLTNLHNNTKLGNATVKFYVSGKYVGSATTNKYGVASFYYTAKCNNGTYTLTTKYLTNNTYNGSSNSNKLKIS
ncbi:MAG: hypothetical protein F8N15_07985, partial [Methanobacterium sp.]|nr:hypothetical protein [Methanobacterium sp.]